MKSLFEVMRTRGEPIETTPFVDGKEVDLYQLYQAVMVAGGSQAVRCHAHRVVFLETDDPLIRRSTSKAPGTASPRSSAGPSTLPPRPCAMRLPRRSGSR
jgi:hypothetical protein